MSVKVLEKPKGSGVWWIFIDFRNKRKAKKIGRDKRVAHDVAKKIEARLTLGDFFEENNESDVPFLKDYAIHWLDSYIKGLRRESTYDRYSGMLKKYILPRIGNMTLDSIKRKHVKNLLLDLYNEGLSKSSVSLVNNIIGGIMNHAIDEELIEVNPTSGIIKLLNLNRTKRILIEPLTSDEVSLILKTCLENFHKNYPFFLTSFRTGMRLGELLALEWSDVDWNGMFIKVRKSYKLGKIGPTKSGKERRVDMSDQLYGELKMLHRIQLRDAFKKGKKKIKIIFHHNGNYIEQHTMRKIFKSIHQKAGIKVIRLHDIRHTFASLLLSAGYSPVYVKEQLGHHSIQITVDTYGHLIPGSNREAVNSLDDRKIRNLYATN